MKQSAAPPPEPLPESSHPPITPASHQALTAEDLALLLGHQLFSGLPEQAIVELLTHCPVIFLHQGEILLSPGAENHHLYLLRNRSVVG